jgi:hypothetical protein
VRTLLVLALLAAPVYADRSTTFEVGLTGDVRAMGASFAEAGASSDLAKLAGLQLVLSFEDAPLALPAPGRVAAELRLVPELLAGFVADTVHAEGMIGGGLRGELQLAANKQSAVRTSLYLAARAVAIGAHRDGAVELMMGEYLTLAHDRRFGWEGGAMIRPRTDGVDHELDTLLTIYYGWR